MWCNVHNNTLLINLQTREAYKNAFLPIFLSPAQNEASRAESLTAGWLAAQCAYAATRNWETAGISGGFNWRVSVSRNLIIAMHAPGFCEYASMDLGRACCLCVPHETVCSATLPLDTEDALFYGIKALFHVFQTMTFFSLWSRYSLWRQLQVQRLLAIAQVFLDSF